VEHVSPTARPVHRNRMPQRLPPLRLSRH
jgi:hypothetical protein